MEIEFDPVKAAANLRKHKVRFAHAEQAMRDPMAMTVGDPDSEGEQRLVTLDMDALGRILVVIHTPQGDKPFAISRRVRPVVKKGSNTMRKEYDFSKGKRGAVIASPGKTRITIMLDDDVIEHFRKCAEAAGSGYQTLINAELRQAVDRAGGKEIEPLTVAKLREVIRQELAAA